MKTLPKFIIIALSCFCAVDLIFIQSDFFFSCASQPRNYSTLHPICDNLMRLQSVFTTAASTGIAAIVGISAIYSPKKSLIIVLVLGGLYLSDIVLSQIYTLSLDATSATNSNLRIMRPMTNTEWIMHVVSSGQLWWVILSALMLSSITWPIVVLRKKMGKILR